MYLNAFFHLSEYINRRHSWACHKKSNSFRSSEFENILSGAQNVNKLLTTKVPVYV